MKHYFMFGDEQVASYENNEFKGLMKSLNNDLLDWPETFMFEDGVTTPEALLDAFNGNGNYVCISEKEYNKLNGL